MLTGNGIEHMRIGAQFSKLSGGVSEILIFETAQFARSRSVWMRRRQLHCTDPLVDVEIV